MAKPFLFAQNGQQIAGNMLPTATVNSSQCHPTEDASHKSNGQFTMYSDFLNSSDPSSLLVTSTKEQQRAEGSLTQRMLGSGTSSVNGQLLFISQPEMQKKLGNQRHDQMNEGQNQQTQRFEKVTRDTTISRQ